MEKISDFLEKTHIKKGFSVVFGAAKTAFTYTQERVWTIYSAAMVICVFQMIAMSSEKQIMADHYYGAAAESELNEDKRQELLKESKKLFDEEVSLSVKERVWQLPAPQFNREYASRHGASI